MPKLPDFTDLSGVAPSAPRSMVDIPVPDIAGTARTVADAVGQVGTSIENVRKEREEKARKQERFDTKMGLLKAEEAYADRVKDLDPLDPEYVEKKRAARRETFSPVLSGVKDPENRMEFDLATQADYVELGIRAEGEQRAALGKKAEIDVAAYADGLRKKMRTEGYTGDAREELRQAIEDNQFLDQTQKEVLFRELGNVIDADSVEATFENISTTGISLTPEVNAAIASVQNTPGVAGWMGGYLGRLATIESAGGRKVLNPENPDVAGVWQFASATGKDFGLNSREDRLDVAKSTEAVVKLTMRNFSALQEALGRGPTPGELYLAHQQGASGAIKLLTDPDAKAVDAVGVNAVRLNLPESVRGKAGNISAGQFAQLWTGKFDGGGAIDANEVMGVIEQSPAYARLGPDAQDKIKSDILTRVEKRNKEVEKNAVIDMQRSVVDQAVSTFEDRNKAEAYVKSSIADADAREDALKMLRAQYSQIDENERVAYKQTLDGAYDAVTAAIDAGDVVGAYAAIPADIRGEDRANLKKLIADGRAVTDDPELYDSILSLKLGTPEDRASFANMDLRPLIGKLKPSTIEGLAKEQESLKKQLSDTGKVVSLETPAAMLDQRLREIEIDTSSKASPADLRTARSIRSIMAQNLQNATRSAGRDLTPPEVEKVMDQTFMQFRSKQAGWFSTSEVDLGLPDVMELFTEEEGRLEMPEGALINEAIADFQSVGLEITPQNLNEWLKRKMDGAAQ
jgi:hypothetical protein